MDTTSRRPQLPALSYLDIEKGKSEEEAYSNRNTGASQTYSRAAANSPSYQHPIGPPPPYSQATSQQTNGWSSVNSEVHATSESRRPSGEEYENTKQMSRQSLPSISEALGVDGQTSYSSSTSAIQAPSHSTAPVSPTPTARRSYGMETSQFQNAYGSNTTSQYRSFRQDSAGPQSYPPLESSKGAYSHSNDSRSDSRPTLHVQTAQPARTGRVEKPYQRPASPPYEQPSSQSAGSMGPPGFQYGYAPYPQRYVEPTPPSSHSSGPIYQPSAQYAPPSQTLSSGWKSENSSSRFAPDERSPASGTYGESVKRHLELYDFEAALNDVSQTSSIVLDFSRRYGDRMHQTARSGPSLSTLPGAVEVEDMINKSRRQLDSLNKIREVIIAQQVAFEQQVADQRHQSKSFREPAPQVADSHGEEESKVGFAGSETKKRRGRAAPPGRCHSCNRAETPEWRRGPDGARTLCNACGLHYAKLTRKQTNANKSANVASSNLRPKES